MIVITEPNIDGPDDLYARLVAMYDGLDERRAAIASARLVLLLANHIGDRDVIDTAISAARGAPTSDNTGTES